MKLFYVALACAVLIASPQLRAAPAAPAVSEARIQELVTQLGDADFQKREAASQEIKKIGKPALPALQANAKHDDPEVRVRVTELIEAIAPSPAATDSSQVRIQPGKMMLFGDGVVRVQVQARAINLVDAANTTKFELDGKKYEVTRTDTKITVRVTETVKNRNSVRIIKADNDEDLAKKDPELAKIVAEHAAKPQPVEIKINGGNGADK